jgi:hypothetical protein
MGKTLILKTPPEIPGHDLFHAHNIRIIWFCHIMSTLTDQDGWDHLSNDV